MSRPWLPLLSFLWLALALTSAPALHAETAPPAADDDFEAELGLLDAQASPTTTFRALSVRGQRLASQGASLRADAVLHFLAKAAGRGSDEREYAACPSQLETDASKKAYAKRYQLADIQGTVDGRVVIGPDLFPIRLRIDAAAPPALVIPATRAVAHASFSWSGPRRVLREPCEKKLRLRFVLDRGQDAELNCPCTVRLTFETFDEAAAQQAEATAQEGGVSLVTRHAGLIAPRWLLTVDLEDTEAGRIDAVRREWRERLRPHRALLVRQAIMPQAR